MTAATFHLQGRKRRVIGVLQDFPIQRDKCSLCRMKSSNLVFFATDSGDFGETSMDGGHILSFVIPGAKKSTDVLTASSQTIRALCKDNILLTAAL